MFNLFKKEKEVKKEQTYYQKMMIPILEEINDYYESKFHQRPFHTEMTLVEYNFYMLKITLERLKNENK